MGGEVGSVGGMLEFCVGGGGKSARRGGWHRWSGAVGAAEDAALDGRGFVETLGNPGLQARNIAMKRWGGGWWGGACSSVRFLLPARFLTAAVAGLTGGFSGSRGCSLISGPVVRWVRGGRRKRGVGVLGSGLVWF